MKLYIRLTLILQKKSMRPRLPMLLNNKINVHQLALTPAKYHKKFFAEISSMKISFLGII